jgi:hydrogenase expression/formation protein HypE
MTEQYPPMEGPLCPMPKQHDEQIVIGHGSGGRMTQNLIRNVFQSHFTSQLILAGDDFARVGLPQTATLEGTLSISTDTHVVTPLFFPGGDIGNLAVCGTVNDVCMSGSKPLYLTAGFILEEGLPMDTLDKIVASMQVSAEEAGVEVIAGDTKVVERGKVDKIFINTAGIGWTPPGRQIDGKQAKPGDIILISGNIGDHGIAVLAARGDLGFKADIQSDVAPLNHMIEDVLIAAPHIHVLRDPTRGGVATTLNEIAVQSDVGILIEETAIPVQNPVRAACEMLGFDPLYLANEGKVIVIVPPEEEKAALDAMQNHIFGSMATRIGIVTEEEPGRVLLRTLIGGKRLLDVLAGEILPRIC